MTEILPIISILGVGFVLGIEHAFEADHVAAVSVMLNKTRSVLKSSLLGLFWGLGHSLMLLITGFFILVFKLSIPQRLSFVFEAAVGVMLVVLGSFVIKKMRSRHVHEHSHGSIKHVHVHSIKMKHNHLRKSFLIGMLHGLAGSAALSLLVLTTVNSFTVGFIYILFFGAGSIGGMMMVSGLLGLPFKYLGKNESIYTYLQLVAGLVSMGIGLIVIYNSALNLL